MKKIGIVGSRRRSYEADLAAVSDALDKRYEDGDQIVSGGCPAGADYFAEHLAKKRQIPIMIYYARWDKHGRSAGYIRNTDIVTDSDILLACVAPDRVGGTEDTVKKFCAKFSMTEDEAIANGKLFLL